MSKFLGPIHHWLYNKIKLQAQLVEEIKEYIKAQYTAFEVSAEVLQSLDRLEEDTQYTFVENLEEVIDVGNIHGWLQNQIHIVENNLAITLTTLKTISTKVQNHVELDFYTLISKVAYDFGKLHSNLTLESLPREGFQFIQDTLLDGMPCDHTVSLMENKDDYITFRRNQCVHKEYYENIGGSVADYYHLKEGLIRGFLSPTKLQYEEIGDNLYQIHY